MPTPQNGQTHSNHASAKADKLFECVLPFCGVGTYRVNPSNNIDSTSRDFKYIRACTGNPCHTQSYVHLFLILFNDCLHRKEQQDSKIAFADIADPRF